MIRSEFRLGCATPTSGCIQVLVYIPQLYCVCCVLLGAGVPCDARWLETLLSTTSWLHSCVLAWPTSMTKRHFWAFVCPLAQGTGVEGGMVGLSVVLGCHCGPQALALFSLKYNQERQARSSGLFGCALPARGC